MITFINRNLKMFFRDKTAVFFSLLAVFIVLGLYIVFLGDVWVDSFKEIKGAKNLMNCWIMAGLIGVTSVTANIGAFGIMVEDKSKNKIKDFILNIKIYFFLILNDKPCKIVSISLNHFSYPHLLIIF